MSVRLLGCVHEEFTPSDGLTANPMLTLDVVDVVGKCKKMWRVRSCISENIVLLGHSIPVITIQSSIVCMMRNGQQ